MSTYLKAIQLLACMGSLAAVFLCRGMESAIKRVPWGTTDSMGRPMGFNDPFSREHWGILLRTIDWQDYRLDADASGSLVFWILAGMHVAAAGWILCADARRLRTPLVFLGAQVLVFPGSIVGVLVLPLYLVAAVRGEFDREGIIDGPLFTWAGQAVWLLTCLASVLMTLIHQRRTAWRRLKEASRG